MKSKIKTPLSFLEYRLYLRFFLLAFIWLSFYLFLNFIIIVDFFNQNFLVTRHEWIVIAYSNWNHDFSGATLL